ncbi:MAG: ABC transporter ATP-binding protein [Clostridia bacterium]|nr:ABC transporter ATP-binding protein [Clostridia bacterium]
MGGNVSIEKNKIAVKMKNITKTFGAVTANKDVSLEVYRGEILSLLGENGSGKTTLMNMLSGIYYPDSGEIEIDGKAASISSPKDAFELGIGMIHQHFKLIDVFTSAENIILGLPGGALLDMKSVYAGIEKICEKYGFDVDPKRKVYTMSVSQKQELEIVKALYRGAEILILDEPTAVLTPQETKKLFDVLRNMKNDGKAIVIITHKLNEVMEISDRVAILRRGEFVTSIDTKSANEKMLAEAMVGQKLELNIRRPEPKDEKLRLSVSGLSCRNSDGVPALSDVSFDAYGGEILGIAGVSGSGQKELLEAIAGLQQTDSGKIIFYPENEGSEPENIIGMNPRKIREMGVALSFVPEDRLGMGLVGSMGMTENMMLKSYDAGAPVFIHKKEPEKTAERVKNELDVVTPNLETPVRRLSGGNVQKVLVGREISEAPSVLMTAYAVRGLDINTSYAIYDLLDRQKERGVAVIYVGEDLDVMLALCDRILVLCGGRVSAVVDARSVTKEEIGLYMTAGSGAAPAGEKDEASANDEDTGKDKDEASANDEDTGKDKDKVSANGEGDKKSASDAEGGGEKE